MVVEIDCDARVASDTCELVEVVAAAAVDVVDNAGVVVGADGFVEVTSVVVDVVVMGKLIVIVVVGDVCVAELVDVTVGAEVNISCCVLFC